MERIYSCEDTSVTHPASLPWYFISAQTVKTLRVQHAAQVPVAVEPVDERLVRGLRAHEARDGGMAAEPVDVECAHFGGEGAGVGAREDLRR